MLKAIETVYNGYRFRSRLEARWAVFFDALRIEHQYEPEGFDLGGGVYYLPDFWLPGRELWVEIKGKPPTEEEIGKATRLAQQGGHPVVIFWGDFAVKKEHNSFYCFKDEDGVFRSHTDRPIDEILIGTHLARWNGVVAMREAKIAARQAWFEHKD